MLKGVKKLRVTPDKALDWLNRFERGERISDISKKDFYDKRTVRSQIDLARDTRDNRAIRQQIIKDKLEKHYDTLCAFANDLKGKAKLEKPETVFSFQENEPMWVALRQHLPKARLWRSMKRWDSLADDYRGAMERLRERIKREAESGPGMKFSSSTEERGLYEGFIDSLAFHLHEKALGRNGLDVIHFKQPIKTPFGKRIERGAWAIGLVGEDKVKVVQEMFNTLMKKAMKWGEYDILAGHVKELSKTYKPIVDELTRIYYRGIVPGKCIYCPF